jgi:thioredoxin 1
MKEILYFSAPWCAPCKQLGPIMAEVGQTYDVRKINVDEDTETPVKYGIRNVPTLVLVRDGNEELARLNGVQSKETIINFYKNN